MFNGVMALDRVGWGQERCVRVAAGNPSVRAEVGDGRGRPVVDGLFAQTFDGSELLGSQSRGLFRIKIPHGLGIWEMLF